MTPRSLLLSAFAFFFLLAVPKAQADSIPYSKVGTVATEVPVYASGNGGVTVYYFGSTAGYTDYVRIYDLQTGFDSGKILNNKTTSVGASMQVGTVAGQINAGDQLIFYIVTPYNSFASLASYNSDGINHAYITPYSGGTANGVRIPAGFFVGLEDLPKSTSDLNYNDDTFVFTGISAPSTVTPEPSSLVLLLTGLLAPVAFYGIRRAGV